MAITKFNTERLSVYDWTPTTKCQDQRARLEDALKSLLTESVLQHLPPALHLNDIADGVSAWIDERDTESDVLLVERKEDGKLIGLLMLSPEEEGGRVSSVHVGYLLAETAWGRGIATELMAGLISAMMTLKPVTLVGGVDKNNPASARVLQKAGFKLDRQNPNPDVEFYFRLIE